MAHRAGDLRRQVLLQKRSVTQDGIGGQATTWTTIATMKAQINPLNGRELIAAQAVHNATNTEIVIRYRPGITPDMRIVYLGVAYNILDVIDEETRHQWMTLACTSGLSQG